MGNIKLTLFLAFKSIIRGNRWTLILVIVMMALSFANLLVTPSILSGLTDTFDRQQIDNLLANIIVDPPSYEYYLDHVGPIEKRIEQIPGVIGVSSHLNNTAFFEYEWEKKASPEDKGKSGTWPVIGIDPSREVNVTKIASYIIEGSYLSPNDRDEIVIGAEIAGGSMAVSNEGKTLQGVKVGDEVRLTYPNGVQREYIVKGIFQSREIIQADRMTFITRKEMASVLGRQVYDDRASQILIKTGQGAEENQVISEIESLGLDAEVKSWREYGGTASGIVSSFDIIASLINTIGLAVAGIVMFIIIYISVINKKRQIGILRAIGIKRDVIVGSYLLQAIFYAMLGIISGGLFFGYVITPYFDLHPLELSVGRVSLVIESGTVTKAVMGILVASVLAGILPALHITRQNIIKSIWGN